jgi:hypothetical protein
MSFRVCLERIGRVKEIYRKSVVMLIARYFTNVSPCGTAYLNTYA